MHILVRGWALSIFFHSVFLTHSRNMHVRFIRDWNASTMYSVGDQSKVQPVSLKIINWCSLQLTLNSDAKQSGRLKFLVIG